MARSRWDFSLDGKQVAAVSVAALVVLASAFALGVNVGRHRAERRAVESAPDPLQALDEVTENLPAPPPPGKYTYPELAKDQPAEHVVERAEPRREAPASATPVAAAATAPPAAAPAPALEAARAAGPWTIQVGSSTQRSEAERLAARHAARGATVVSADVGGKRWYRVRLGGWGTRAEAERALAELRLPGFVTAGR